jgi:hypothetical protein
MAKKNLNKFRWTMRLFVFALFIMMIIEIVFIVNVKLTNWKMLHDIQQVDENSYRTFQKFVNDIQDETDWEVAIISGLRSKEKQLELKRENPKNAAIGKSRHVLGRAIDINLYKRESFRRIWLKKFSSKTDWRNTGVVKIAARYKLLWGGTYRNYHDPVHFEIP